MRARFLALVLVSVSISACAAGLPVGSNEASGSRAITPPAVADTSSAASSARGPASPQSNALAVVVNQTLSFYNVSLIGEDGKVHASATASRRTVITLPSPNGPLTAVDLPYVSTTLTRVYYLDGDSNIQWLEPGVGPHAPIPIPGSATAHAGFAVSPDNSQIAVSVIDYSHGSQAVNMRLLVGPLGGQLNQIFTSSTDFVWPVGWHAGNLVVATQNRPPFSFGTDVGFNPYGATSFHIVDPRTANRVGVVGNTADLGGCSPTGLLEVAGTACYVSTAFGGQSGGYAMQNWQGNRYFEPKAASWSAAPSLAPEPSSTRVMVCCEALAASGRFLLSTGDGASVTDLSGSASQWACWLDENFVLGPSAGPSVGLLDAGSGQVTTVNAQGFCAGVVPTNLG